ncbi:hypothetical protein IT396_01665 [Candidatus Nomurabacteria bacterium]|nr:hypothetical protein [Candidatus Nomurabacteria bacterium]
MNLIKKTVSPARIYEIQIVAISAAEWAANAALTDGNDRRFRFTRGQLFDEAMIGDARA